MGKGFNLYEDNLKNIKFEEKLNNYEAKVTKKLRIKDPNYSDIKNLINKNDININENYFFNKKIIPKNLQNLNHLNFNMLMKDKNSLKTKEKFIIFINEDKKINRNIMSRIKKLSKKNPKYNFYYMYITPKNEIFIKEKFNLEFKKYPQMIVYRKNKNKNKTKGNFNINDNENENDIYNNENLNLKINLDFFLIPEKFLLSYNNINFKFEELNKFINDLI